MSVNKVILIGHVGRDPEIWTNGELTKASFSLATSESWTNKQGEKVTQTEWHNIVIWRGLARVVQQYVQKGHKLYLEGKITTESYEGREGDKRYRSVIIVNNMQMLGAKKTEVTEPDQQQPQDAIPDIPNENDDLPF